MRLSPWWSLSTSLAVLLFLTRNAGAQEAPGFRQDLPPAETYRFEALVAALSPSANVVVSSDAPGVTGTRIDLRSDLGLVDRRFPELQFTWRPALKHKFRFQYIPIHFDSAAPPPRDLIFNGVTYPAGVSTTASLDWTTYRFGYEFDFIVKRRGSVGFIAEVKHTIVRAELRSATADEVSRQAMPVPALGGFARVYATPRLALTGEVTFFGVPDRPDRHYGGHIADVDLSAVWQFTRYLGAQAGFRDIDINHLGEWNTATFTLKGVYVAAVVRY